ncbi:MAG: cardiolipin synthase [Ktedonobacterales bacterium]
MTFPTLIALFWQDLTWEELLLILSDWTIRIVMLIVVPQRRAPAAARAWLILIFLLPWPGLLVYLVLGKPRVAEQRLERHATYQQRLAQRVRRQIDHWRERQALPPFSRMAHASQRQLPAQAITAGALVATAAGNASDGVAPGTAISAVDPATNSEADPMEYVPERFQPTVALTQALTHLPILDGNAVELLEDYNATIDRLIADINAAQDTVHVLYYIFAADVTGRKVADALVRAAARGVTCRVLVDALGSRPALRALLPKLRAGGIEAYAVSPFSLAHLFRRHRTSRIDLRNHRKIVVLDGQIAYTGSQNIVDADFKRGIVYEELVARLTGGIVRQLQAVFLGDWYLETQQLLEGRDVLRKLTRTGEIAAQALPSGPEYPIEANQRLFTSLLHCARRRIVLTSPYFIPDAALLNALETAALRGVETHLVVSQAADQFLVCQAQRSFYAELLAMGVQIHLYTPAFLHAKHLSVDDDLVVIGSSNLDRRSFALNAEISVVFYGNEVAKRLHAIEQRYFEHALALTAEEWAARPWYSKILQNIARLMDVLL